MNCTGDVIVPTYDLSDISLTSNGPGFPNGGHDPMLIKQVYQAANATGSDVLFRWYEPESMVDIFHGTDYEFYRLTLLRRVNNTSAIGYTYTKVLFKSLH